MYCVIYKRESEWLVLLNENGAVEVFDYPMEAQKRAIRLKSDGTRAYVAMLSFPPISRIRNALEPEVIEKWESCITDFDDFIELACRHRRAISDPDLITEPLNDIRDMLINEADELTPAKAESMLKELNEWAEATSPKA